MHSFTIMAGPVQHNLCTDIVGQQQNPNITREHGRRKSLWLPLHVQGFKDGMHILTRVRDYPHKLISLQSVSAIHGNFGLKRRGAAVRPRHLSRVFHKTGERLRTYTCQGAVTLRSQKERHAVKI